MSEFLANNSSYIWGPIVTIVLLLNAWVGYNLFRGNKKVQPTEVSLEDIQKQYGYNYYEAYTYTHYYNMLNAMRLKNIHWGEFYSSNWWQYVINREEVIREKAEDIIRKAQRDFDKAHPTY